LPERHIFRFLLHAPLSHAQTRMQINL
jgi:hypothetical protein